MSKIEGWTILSVSEYMEQLTLTPALKNPYNHFSRLSVSTKGEHIHILYIQQNSCMCFLKDMFQIFM